MRGQLFFGTPILQVPGSGDDDDMFLVNISLVDYP
jgi:hypothetical protein